MVVELVAAGPAQLEARLEQVDEPLGVAQLGRRHPVEVAVAERLGRAVCVGGRDVAVDVRLVDRFVAARHRDRRPVDAPLLAPPLVVRGRPGFLVAGLGRDDVVGGHRRGAVVWLRPAALAPPAVEDPVVDLEVVAAPHEDRGTGRPDRRLLADVDERQGPGVVDGRAQVDVQARGPQRPPEPDGFGEQQPAVDRVATERRSHDGGIGRLGHRTLRRKRRPR